MKSWLILLHGFLYLILSSSMLSCMEEKDNTHRKNDILSKIQRSPHEYDVQNSPMIIFEEQPAQTHTAFTFAKAQEIIKNFILAALLSKKTKN